jgi:hypothetical protein
MLTVLLTITPFKSPQGEILGYMGIATDLSIQKVLDRFEMSLGQKRRARAIKRNVGFRSAAL